MDLQDGDLRLSIDFRQVYVALLEKWLGIPSPKTTDWFWHVAVVTLFWMQMQHDQGDTPMNVGNPYETPTTPSLQTSHRLAASWLRLFLAVPAFIAAGLLAAWLWYC